MASVITAPAPNAGQFLRQELGSAEQVKETLRRRAHHVLAIARQHGHRNVLLGAWGCGVFCNDPEHVSHAFGEWLEAPEFAGSFDRVVFGIYDRTPGQHVLNNFKARFAPQATPPLDNM